MPVGIGLYERFWSPCEGAWERHVIALLSALALRLGCALAGAADAGPAPGDATDCVVAVDTDRGPAVVLAPCAGPRPVFLAFGEEWI